MPETRYRLREAATELAAAGLLSRALAGGREVHAAALCGAFAGAVLDSRQVTTDVLFVALPGEHVDGRAFIASALAAGACALSDEVDPTTLPDHGTVLVSPRPRAALARLAACWRARQTTVHVIGVTGTNGKTTTKDLLVACLSAAGPVHATARNLNNDLGVPLTLLGLNATHRYAVVEMGASAVGEIAALGALAQPAIGIITNAAAAHLAGFGSLAGVIRGKGEMLDVLPPDGVAILNHDSPGFSDWQERAHGPVVTFGRDGGDHRWRWEPGAGEPAGWLHLDDTTWAVPLPGEHNAANLAAAVLAARAAGVDDAAIARGLASFAPSPHRGHVRRLGGRVLLDDCYNANPESLRGAAAALLTLQGGVAWAAVGAMGELGDRSAILHHETGHALAALGIARLVAVGEAARPLVAGFDEGGGIAEYCATHARAADVLAAATSPGDRILVKGSRSSAMEKLIDELARRWPGPDAPE